MSGNAKQSEVTRSNPSSRSGTAYDVCRRVKQADGSEKLKRIGTVFIRSSGSGGVAFLAGADGKKQELAIFARKPRKPAAPTGSEPAAEAAPARAA